MIGWFLESIWQAALGLVLLLGALVGATFVLGRAIYMGTLTEHDAKRCDCPSCMRRRANAWEKHKARTDKLRTLNGGWLSTEDLRTADQIEAKGGIYEVINLIGDAKGVQVHLNNLSTGKKSVVFVRMERLQVRYWKKAD